VLAAAVADGFPLMGGRTGTGDGAGVNGVYTPPATSDTYDLSRLAPAHPGGGSVAATHVCGTPELVVLPRPLVETAFPPAQAKLADRRVLHAVAEGRAPSAVAEVRKRRLHGPATT